MRSSDWSSDVCSSDLIGDIVEAAQDVLDLAGRDILAAAHDHVVEPPFDEQIAALVEPACVVGREPAVVGDRLPVQIFARHLLAADMDLAMLAGRTAGTVLAPNLEFDARQRLADRRDTAADQDRKSTRLNSSH